ncbi:FAD/NAD(P)-binding domain-containing protein [Dendrothele bispora CBS 962.96]|uniref:FAD/NAD(P)-binding domain-containing protein n=1 Tax=Dendrothele bispora (strain CBS 962.96) TaxID=1314807 RepID=A0A4S8LAU1_DENBC|nr:FAD/NAD(P)-binding domain-containing protein [Dendrothele bispora CBS 962.96]
MSKSQSQNGTPRIVVIGAGVGGISFGIALRRRFPGFENFTIYEKAADVGGTWRDNTYPGCSSDVPIHFFSASTDPSPDWDYTHGFQPQIQKYWIDLHKKYDLYNHTQFNALVVSAEWDPTKQAYDIVTKDLLTRKETKSTAEIVVSALGVLEITKIPEFDGIETFKGEMFHSGAWDHSVSLKGKRVGVVGNGASATQFVPVISEDSTTTVVDFCRTPNWFLPPIRTPYSGFQKWLFRHLPLWMKLHRLRFFLTSEVFYALVFGSPLLRRLYSPMARKYIEKNAPKEYVDKLIPTYTMGCKRVIFDTDFLAALHRPNVDITFDGIESIYEGGIVTKKGERKPFDVLIFATGFVTDDFPLYVRGTKETVREYYAHEGGPKAYLGTTVPGFPNFFLISGPNTVTGHTSVIYTEEVQINYIMQVIRPILQKRIGSVDVRGEATDRYNEKIHERLERSVFVDCVSWYRKGRDGKVSSVFPGAGTLFWWWLRKVDWRHYEVDRESKERWEKELGRRRFWSVVRRLVVLSAVVGLVVVFGRSEVGRRVVGQYAPGKVQSVVDVLKDVYKHSLEGLRGLLAYTN